jgi:hypothetical protein
MVDPYAVLGERGSLDGGRSQLAEDDIDGPAVLCQQPWDAADLVGRDEVRG